MLPDEVRRLALSLPGSTEEPHFDMASFRVRGRIFATLPPDGVHLHVFLDEWQSRALAAADPDALDELRWGRKLRGVRVNLSAARREQIFELLADAWRRKAPRALAAMQDRSPTRSGDR